MISREDIELYVMGQYDGDLAALERAIADDPALGAQLADAARLELIVREAAAAAKFCPACDDLVRGERCDSCGAAVAPGGYTVERVLVSNAHGRMYVARDADGKQVALKELAFVQTPSPSAVATFERETKFLRALEHSAIPRFVASFEEGSGVHARYYLAQELVAGTPLDHLEEHWYSEPEIIDIARQVLAILVYLQALTPMVIHRDIKPANLIKRSDGTIALVDFGAAHVQGATAGSTTIGTFGYMPIEQLAGIVDATTDVYALGMTLLHLMTRQEPWRLVQDRATVNASAALRAWLDKAVAQDSRARFASAKDALAALERREAPRVRRPRRRWFAIAGAAVTAMAVGGGISAYRHQHVHEGSTIAILRVELPPGVSAKLELDGQVIAKVIDRQEVPITAGHHRIVLRGEGGDRCTGTFSAESGKTTTFECELSTTVERSPDAGIMSYDIRPRLDNSVRVTWSFDHAKLHAVVQKFARQCAVNVVVPEAVDGDVSIELDNERCDRAIDAVLGARLLGYVYDPAANLMRIGPAKLLEDTTEPAGDELPAGREIDLDFMDAPITTVLRSLAIGANGRVPVIFSQPVAGTVTISGKAMPWDRAFKAVLVSNGLWYRYDAKLQQITVVRDTRGLPPSSRSRR